MLANPLQMPRTRGLVSEEPILPKGMFRQALSCHSLSSSLATLDHRMSACFVSDHTMEALHHRLCRKGPHGPLVHAPCCGGFLSMHLPVLRSLTASHLKGETEGEPDARQRWVRSKSPPWAHERVRAPPPRLSLEPPGHTNPSGRPYPLGAPRFPEEQRKNKRAISESPGGGNHVAPL